LKKQLFSSSGAEKFSVPPAKKIGPSSAEKVDPFTTFMKIPSDIKQLTPMGIPFL